jgi:hypothetical protein
MTGDTSEDLRRLIDRLASRDESARAELIYLWAAATESLDEWLDGLDELLA